MMKKYLIVLILVVLLISPLYAIAETIGTPTYIVTGGATNNYITSTPLTDTTAIIVFCDASDSNKGKAVLCTNSGGTLSMGSPVYLRTGGTANAFTAISRLTDTTAIIAFKDTGDSNKGKAVLCTNSGGTLSMGSPVYLRTGGTINSQIAISRLTDTAAIIAFKDESDSYKGKAVLCTNSGGTLSMGSPVYIRSGGTSNSYMMPARLTDTTAIIAFTDDSDSYKGKAVLCTNSGGTLSMGSPVYIRSGGINQYPIAATPLTSTTALISFTDYSDSYKIKVALCTNSSGTLSMGSPSNVTNSGASGSYIAISRLTDTTAIIAFKDTGDSNKGKAVLCTNSGGTLSMGSPVYLITGGTSNTYESISRLTDTTAIIAFKDTDDSNKGKAIHISYSTGYIYKIYGVTPVKVNGVVPKKINGI